ncbi:hypothetical protein ACXR2U_12545 [Jatrophihabitans sp. YIM 134969]
MRTLPAVVVAALLVAGGLVAAPPAVAAGTAYTWRGLGDIESWNDPRNWTPIGVPGNGDSATILAYNDNICHAHVTGVPSGLTLTDLTVDEHAYLGHADSACLTSLDGGSITVTHAFSFHAGTIDTPVTLAAGATGAVTPGVVVDTTHFGGPVTVDGVLTLAGNTAPRDLSLTGSPGVTVDAGGTLATSGNNDVSADCCDSVAHVTNHGTVQIARGTLALDAVALDQDALLTATGGGTVRTTFAPQSAGPGARWTGDGVWQLGRTSTTTVSGTQTLAKTFRWQLGGHGSTSEEFLVGRFTLDGGRFDWNGGSIGAAMTVGPTTKFIAAGPDGPDPRQIRGVDAGNQPVSLVNRGTMTFSGGAGWSGSEGPRLTNTATGTVTFGAGTTGASAATATARVVNAGAFTVASGTFTARGGFTQSAGRTTLTTGGVVDLAGGPALTVSGGTLAGSGQVTGALAVAGGSLAPGGKGTVGTLTVTGGLTTSSTSTSLFDVGTGTHDAVTVGGSANLHGTARFTDLPGSAPATGDSVTVVTASAVAAKFACTTTVGDGSDVQHWTADVVSANLQLVSEPGAMTSC